MAYTYEELKHSTLAHLRDIAAGLDQEAVSGYTQMNKEHLLGVICQALHIDMHAHHEVKGINKSSIKSNIRDLKKEREVAISAQDRKQLKQVRRRIHRLKRAIHRATV